MTDIGAAEWTRRVPVPDTFRSHCELPEHLLGLWSDEAVEKTESICTGANSAICPALSVYICKHCIPHCDVQGFKVFDLHTLPEIAQVLDTDGNMVDMLDLGSRQVHKQTYHASRRRMCSETWRGVVGSTLLA